MILGSNRVLAAMPLKRLRSPSPLAGKPPKVTAIGAFPKAPETRPSGPAPPTCPPPSRLILAAAAETERRMSEACERVRSAVEAERRLDCMHKVQGMLLDAGFAHDVVDSVTEVLQDAINAA